MDAAVNPRIHAALVENPRVHAGLVVGSTSANNEPEVPAGNARTSGLRHGAGLEPAVENKERVMGLGPTTYTLATCRSTN